MKIGPLISAYLIFERLICHFFELCSIFVLSIHGQQKNRTSDYIWNTRRNHLQLRLQPEKQRVQAQFKVANEYRKIPDSISRIFDQICFLKAPARLEKTPARTEVQKLEENCFYIVNVYMKWEMGLILWLLRRGLKNGQTPKISRYTFKEWWIAPARLEKTPARTEKAAARMESALIKIQLLFWTFSPKNLAF